MRGDELRRLELRAREERQLEEKRAAVAARGVEVPGAAGIAAERSGATRIAELELEVRRRKGELRLAQEMQLAAELPDHMQQPPFEPITPHGAEQIENSKHRHLTTSQLNAAIQAGTEEYPGRAVLCSDGWWTSAD